MILAWTRQPSSSHDTQFPALPRAVNQYDDDADDGCEGEESIFFLFLQGILSVFSLILVGFITFLLVQENFLQHPGTLSPDKSSDMVSVAVIFCLAMLMGGLGFNQLCDLMSTLEDRAASSRYSKKEPSQQVEYNNRKKTIRFEEGTNFTTRQRSKRVRRKSRRRSSELSEEEIRASARLELFLQVVEQKIIEASTKEVARRRRSQDVVESKEEDFCIDSCCVDDDVLVDFKPTLNLPLPTSADSAGLDNDSTAAEAADHPACDGRRPGGLIRQLFFNRAGLE